MKLYNKKRYEAAEGKDDEKVKEYMDKVQNLMQMSKDMIRGIHIYGGGNSSCKHIILFAIQGKIKGGRNV